MFKGDVVKAVVYNKETASVRTKVLIHLGSLQFVNPEDVHGFVDLLKLKRCTDDSRIIRLVNSPDESVNSECIRNYNDFESFFEKNSTLYPVTLRKVKRLAQKNNKY